MTLKIAHIITKLELGGAQLNTLYTVEHLNRKDFTPFLLSGMEGYLVSRAEDIPDVDYIKIENMKRPIQPVRDFKALLEIKKRLEEIEPEIVHTHSSKAGILGRWAARAAGVPLIIHSIHGFAFHPHMNRFKRGFYIFLEKMTAKITDKFIPVAWANVKKGVDTGILEGDDCVVIRSGIDISKYRDVEVDRERKLGELGIEDTGKVVGMIACFKPQKAPLDFIKVCRFVSDMVPEARFLLVGDGELRPEIEEAIRGYDLEDVISCPGWRDDIPEILNSIDVMALTSYWEGLPQVFPQAIAAGVPIVATDVDGAPEAVHPGSNGYLISPGDIRGFADAISLLLDNESLREEMKRAGDDHIKEFDIDKMVREQENLYKNLYARKE